MQTEQVTRAEPPTATAIERKIDRVMQRLKDSLTTVLDELPGHPQRPQELARILKLNKTLSSRLTRAVRTADPLASGHLMPGPEGLRMVLKAAAKNGVRRESIDGARGAITAFDRLIRRDVGDRDALDAIISDSLPHARKKFELYNKQAMYKAVANLKGVTANVYLRTYLIHPGADPLRHDYAMVLGLLGLRRLRPRTVVQVSNVHLARNGKSDARLTLDGEAVEGVDGLLLRPFCSSSLSSLAVRHVGMSLQYVLEGEEIGLSSAVDVIIGEVDRAFFKRYQPAQGRRYSGGFTEVEQPVKTLVFDMLLHEDVWPGCPPELRIYDMVVRGPADPNDPARGIDRLESSDTIEYLGDDIARFRAAEIPQYVDMLRMVCDKLGWDSTKFRGYRCRIQYPFYGSQVCLGFEPPPAPHRSG